MGRRKQYLKIAATTTLALSILACSDNKSADEFLADAKKFQAQKDYNSAVIALKGANAVDTQNAGLRFELGNVYLQLGDYVNSEKELELAQKLGFDAIKIYPKLIETKYKLSKFNQVYALAENANALPDESYIPVLTFAGLAALYQGDKTLAQEFIDSANEISSGSIYGQLGKAYLSNTESEVRTALNNVEGLIAKSPELVDSYLLKGYLLQGLKDYGNAAIAFEEYAELRPKEYQVQFFIAQNYIQSKQLDKAEGIVNKLLKASAEHPFANQMKAQIEFDKKNFTSAQQFAITAYQANKKLVTATIIAGVSAYHSKEYEKAYDHLLKAENKVAADHLVKRLLIELQLRLGYDNQAIESLNSLVESGNADSLMLLSASNELIKSGDKSAAQDMLKASIELATEDPRVLQQQGLMKLKLNDVAASIDILEKSLSLDPDSLETEASLAAAYVSDNQMEKALSIAKSWQAQDDKKLQGLLFEASVLQLNQKHEQAKLLLNEALTLDENNNVIKFKLAEYAHKEGDIERAYQLYTEVVASNTSHAQAMKNVLHLAHKHVAYKSKLEQFYLAEIEQAADNNMLKLGLSYFYSSQQQYNEAQVLLNKIKDSKEPIKGIELVIGDVFVASGQLNKAKESYEAVLALNPAHLLANSKLASIYERKNDIKSALTQIDSALEHHPEHLGFKLLKANYLSRIGEKPAVALLSDLKGSTPVKQHWLYYSTMGNIAMFDKQYEMATDQYQNAYNLRHTNYNVIQLSRAIGRSVNIDASIKVLKHHLNTYESAANVQAMLANAYLEKKNYQLAEVIYEDLLQTKPNNIIALNNLANLNIQQQDKESAMLYANKAYKINSRIPAVIDTYGQALLLSGKAKQALEQFNRALAMQPNNVEFNINKAKALLALGDKAEAKKLVGSLKPNDDKDSELINGILKEL